MAYENRVKAAEIMGIPTMELVRVCNKNAAKKVIACLGKDPLIGFINHLYLDKYIFISVYLKFAMAGYIISTARILYVHLMGVIALLPRHNCYDSMARNLYIHVIGEIMLARK